MECLAHRPGTLSYVDNIPQDTGKGNPWPQGIIADSRLGTLFEMRPSQLPPGHHAPIQAWVALTALQKFRPHFFSG